MIWTWRLENLKIVKFNFHFRYISAVSIRHIVSSGNLSSTDTTILITLSGISDISELKVRVTDLKPSFNIAKWPSSKWYTKIIIFWPSFLRPFMWCVASVSFKNYKTEASDRQLEMFSLTEGGFLGCNNTCNKKDHTTWKTKDKWARKWFMFICAILFEVT